MLHDTIMTSGMLLDLIAPSPDEEPMEEIAAADFHNVDDSFDGGDDDEIAI